MNLEFLKIHDVSKMSPPPKSAFFFKAVHLQFWSESGVDWWRSLAEVGGENRWWRLVAEVGGGRKSDFGGGRRGWRSMCESELDVV